MDLVAEGFYRDKIWFQCDYEDCLKWRLLTNEEAAFVDPSKPWYCHMSHDSWFNCCSVPEESYPEESVFEKCGLKLVYSQLPLGSLVLSKIGGWPSWPSILCADGFTGEYVMYDEDGFVEQYHIEFLGKPHTRAWIAVRYVEPYCTGKLSKDLKRSKQWYKSALEEATVLSGLTSEERLKKGCQLSNQDLLKKSYKKKNKRLTQNKMTADKTENLNKVKGYKQSKRDISQSTSRRYKRKHQKHTQDSLRIIGINDTLARESMDVLQAEDLMQDLEDMLKQIKESDKCTNSFMMENQESSKYQGHENKLPHWKAMVSEDTELKDSTDDEEDCILIDGIEFKTGKYLEEITDQLKEIDVIMAELEGCL
ncbi:zinc finger CW-type PWWP domain protein 2-like [Scyliorhinus canicula]|uniref:zinc finger CW-type PWWP domain protein 2-like n=1 Tax=Scyliorhinus canicula TaxID=7830 RepID=UPI0018F656A1|nr:zinc finger CW-type PWWP domain protein 2-like [Scyliorhinus canicula]XP_038652333.1 zinc finger CW-type PWWP domain protein 2-like [Scyliorhinus canicula]